MFFAGYNYSYLQKTDSAIKTLESIKLNDSDSINNELQTFELASTALLKRNYKKYEALKPKLKYNCYAIKSPELKMDGFYNKLSAHKFKSPAIAGILSALVPGAGKFYAGKRKQALGSFLPIATLGQHGSDFIFSPFITLDFSVSCQLKYLL